MKKKTRKSTSVLINRFKELLDLLNNSETWKTYDDLSIRIDEIINIMILAKTTAHDNKSRRSLLKIICLSLSTLNYKTSRTLVERLELFKNSLE